MQNMQLAVGINAEYAVGIFKITEGSRQDAGGRMQEAIGRRQEAGGRRQEAGGRRQEAGGRRLDWTSNNSQS